MQILQGSSHIGQISLFFIFNYLGQSGQDAEISVHGLELPGVVSGDMVNQSSQHGGLRQRQGCFPLKTAAQA
jgi:hypothetical protein